MNRKQQLFVREYLIDLNATAAAIRAGYSRKTARQHAARLLTNVYISAEIEKSTQARLQKLAITADNVIQELGRLAFFDVRKLFAPDGSLLPLHKLDRDTAAGIAGFELVQVEIPHRLLRGIRLLGRIEGMHSLACQLVTLSEKEKRKKRAEFDEIYSSILGALKH
jgi:Terminase small subunit